MNFGEPWWLWLLAAVGLIGAMLVFSLIGGRARGGQGVRWPRISRVVASAHGVRPTAPRRATTRPWLLLAAMGGTVAALAHPRWGRIDEPVIERAREVMIALDLSRSMLVPDVAPSRIERAKLLTKSLLDSLHGERVGLVVFAGTAFVQVPLSADYQILHEFLPELNPAFMPQGGTDYAGMLRAALEGFGREIDTDRFLIVLSDGESQTEDWREQLPTLRERDVRVLTLGVGTPAGGFIPDGEGGYLKDERGAVVLSRLEPATLQALAQETRGTFRNASTWVDLPALLEATVARGEQGRFTTRRHERLIERFQWFLAPAVLLGLLGLWREVAVRPRSQTVRRPLPSNRPPPMTTATTTATASAVLLLVACTLAGRLPAADAPAPPDAEARVRETIARLAASPAPTARDWRELADRTLVYGTGARMNQQDLEPGAVRDALAAVDLGEQANPSLTDWAKLRADLNALLDTPPEQESPPEEPPPEEQKDQDQKDESSQDQQNQEQEKSEAEQQKQQQQPGKQQNEQQSNQDASSGDAAPKPPESANETPPQPAESQPSEAQMGEMEPPPAETTPPKTPPEEPKTRKIGARPNPTDVPPPTDAASALLQQRMREAAEKDSPARLFQLLEGQSEQPARRGRDW